MSLRGILFAVFVCVLNASTSPAQVKVISAYYGRQAPEKTVEVTDFIQKKFNLGLYSFRLSPSVFGANPNPGRSNVLVVEYSYKAQKNFARAADGQVFSLPGIGAPPQPAAGAALRFENGHAKAIFVYELDRWGAWQWKAQLDPGSVYTARGRPGDNWVVTDRNGRVLRQVQVASNMAPIYLK